MTSYTPVLVWNDLLPHRPFQYRKKIPEVHEVNSYLWKYPTCDLSAVLWKRNTMENHKFIQEIFANSFNLISKRYISKLRLKSQNVLVSYIIIVLSINLLLIINFNFQLGSLKLHNVLNINNVLVHENVVQLNF